MRTPAREQERLFTLTSERKKLSFFPGGANSFTQARPTTSTALRDPRASTNNGVHSKRISEASAYKVNHYKRSRNEGTFLVSALSGPRPGLLQRTDVGLSTGHPAYETALPFLPQTTLTDLSQQMRKAGCFLLQSVNLHDTRTTPPS